MCSIHKGSCSCRLHSFEFCCHPYLVMWCDEVWRCSVFWYLSVGVVRAGFLQAGKNRGTCSCKCYGAVSSFYTCRWPDYGKIQQTCQQIRPQQKDGTSNKQIHSMKMRLNRCTNSHCSALKTNRSVYIIRVKLACGCAKWSPTSGCDMCRM